MKPANISRQRIMAEVKKLSTEKLPYLVAAPLPDNIYNWHFTIQGPENTEFHEGLYHGQILLPYEYPFKPPDIIFMNKNGRFQTNTKICLTITQYHPQEWNSAWTIRTMLEAVISLFAENVQGVGSLASSPDVRKFLAKNSHSYACENCGSIKQLLAPRSQHQTESKVGPLVKQASEAREVTQLTEQAQLPANTYNKIGLKQQLPLLSQVFSKNEKQIKIQREVFKEQIRKKENYQKQMSQKWDFKQRQHKKIEMAMDQDGVERIQVQERGWGTSASQWLVKARQISKNIKSMDSVFKSIKWVD